MTDPLVMTETPRITIINPCTQCGKDIERKVTEGYDGHTEILNAPFFMSLYILQQTNTNPDGFASYHKRHADFCSLECLTTYCHEFDPKVALRDIS